MSGAAGTTDRVVAGRTLDGAALRLDIESGRIAEVRVGTERASDGTPFIVPGLIDLQVNGYAGADVNAADVSVDTVVSLCASLAAAGTTSFLPTIITADAGSIVRAIRTIVEAVERDQRVAAMVAGIHVEGPYLSGADGARGAHAVEHLRDPDVDELASWLAAAHGLLRIVTLAPERPGSTDYIRAAVAAGVLVSIGHTDADSATIHSAASAGASLATHLGNGIAASLPRHPNAIWAQLADDRLAAGFIADGRHLPADTFIAMVRAKGVERSYLVSDAAALAGATPGLHRTPVGGAVEVQQDGGLLLAGTQLLAGSGASLAQCVRRAIGFGLAPDTAVALATEQPAVIAGLQDRGRLRPGMRADLLLLDADLAPSEVLLEGTSVPTSH